MSDDRLLWTHQPPRMVRQPRPGELLWELRKDHHTYACELRHLGEYDVEAQILKDGDLLIGHTLQTKALAVQLAWDFTDGPGVLAVSWMNPMHRDGIQTLGHSRPL